MRRHLINPSGIVLVMIVLQISFITAKKYISTSDESIEKFLYLKDCRHGSAAETTVASTTPPHHEATVKHRPIPLKNPVSNQCMCPRMCCSMCCDCSMQPFMDRQMDPYQNFEPYQELQSSFAPAAPRQPQPQIRPDPNKKTNKKAKPDQKVQPIQSRRNIGFTRDSIKSLISHDEDVKKILKDLVRVTMQKVDLLDMINERRKENKRNADMTRGSDEDDVYEE